MYQQILLDTNIVIEKYPHGNVGLAELRNYGEKFWISVISVCELFSLPGLSETEEKQIIKFISNFKILGVNYPIARRAATLIRTRPNRKYRSDLIIAASALVFNIPILTKNQKDFVRIPDLKIV